MNFKTNYQVDEAPVTNIERMLPAGLGMFGPLRHAARTVAGHAARNAGHVARNVAAKVPKDQANRLACVAAAQVAVPTIGAGCLLSRVKDMSTVQDATLSKRLTQALTPISKGDKGDCDTPTPDHEHLKQQAESFESVKCDTPIPTNSELANSQPNEDKGENDLKREREEFFNKMTKQCESTKPETEFFAEIVKQATNETCNKRDEEEDKQESSESPRGYATSFLLGGKDKMAKSSLEIRSMITDYVRSMSEYFHLLKKHAVVPGELTRQRLAELLILVSLCFTDEFFF